MKLNDFLQSVKAGVSIAMGYASPFAPNPAFIQALLDSGEGGLECSLIPAESAFEVTARSVKRTESPAFGKLVGSVQVTLSAGPNKSNVSIDMGTLHQFVTGNGKTTIVAHRAKGTDGADISTRSGAPIYNFRAKVQPVYKDDAPDILLTWFAKLNVAAAPVPAGG